MARIPAAIVQIRRLPCLPGGKFWSLCPLGLCLRQGRRSPPDGTVLNRQKSNSNHSHFRTITWKSIGLAAGWQSMTHPAAILTTMPFTTMQDFSLEEGAMMRRLHPHNTHLRLPVTQARPSPTLSVLVPGLPPRLLLLLRNNGNDRQSRPPAAVTIPTPRYPNPPPPPQTVQPQ